MKETIRKYLLANAASGDVTALADDESLLEAGVIDSVAMIDLIAFLEKTCKITVDEDDMIPENFDSIEAIAAYVEGKTPAS